MNNLNAFFYHLRHLLREIKYKISVVFATLVRGMLGFAVNMLLWFNSYGIYYEVLNML